MSTDLDDRTPDKPRGMPLHTRILLGLVLGAVTGLIASAVLVPEDPRLAWTVRNLAQPIGGLFVRLLLMVVIPLVFSALVVGVAGVGDIRKLGRVGLKAFAVGMQDDVYHKWYDRLDSPWTEWILLDHEASPLHLAGKRPL